MRKQIQELGDSKNPYKFRVLTADMMAGTGNYSVYYEFHTEGGTEYEVEISFYSGTEYDFAEISFGNVEGYMASYDDETGEHDQFAVMATVMAIVEHFRREFEPEIESKSGKQIRGFLYSPTPRKGEDPGSGNARAKLYRAFVQNRGYKTEPFDDDGVLVRTDEGLTERVVRRAVRQWVASR